MESFTDNDALDTVLNYIKEKCDKLYICSKLAETYDEASNKFSLGYKALTLEGPSDYDEGRMLIIPEINDGLTTRDGDVRFYALVSDKEKKLLLSQELGNSKRVLAGNVFSITKQRILQQRKLVVT